ncbi:hypothetical protein QQ045_002889 [Rhodiola kirilowii]
MGSHSEDNVDMVKVEETKSSEPTVEIKIKTLDSQTYTLRVDKCVPVPTLKEQIATVTGILSERQRLICRGRVLKDDQLLSAYHVEDGHTLHLVVREPIPPSQSINNNAGPDYPPNAADGQGAPGGPRVVVGTFNISDQRQGGYPDISQVLSALIGSLGVPLTRDGNLSDGGQEPSTYVVHRTSPSGIVTDSYIHPVPASGDSQRASHGPTSGPRGHLHPPLIPDSLTTLSQYLNQVTAEFAIANGGEETVPGSPIDGDFDAREHSRVAMRRGLPTAEALAEVLQSTRQLLIIQTAESLNRLAMQLQSQANVMDPSARMSIQSNAMRSGIIFRNLGALLLELGRTTMMLRIGNTPAVAVVNAGPAVFVNESGPNPIMVQPFPMSSVHSGAELGSPFWPTNVDIGLRTGERQSPEPVNRVTMGIPPIASRRQAEVHIRPIRAVFEAVPMRPTQSPDPSRGASRIVFPVMAGVQPTSNNATEGHVGGQLGGADLSHLPGNGRAASMAQYFEHFNTSLDQYLQSVLNNADEQPQLQTAAANAVLPTFPAGASAAAANAVPPGGANTSPTQTAPSEDGIFLSNLLQQIMPYVSQNFASGSAEASSAGDDDGQGNNIAHGGTENTRSSSHRQSDQSSSSSSKDAKRQRVYSQTIIIIIIIIILLNIYH